MKTKGKQVWLVTIKGWKYHYPSFAPRERRFETLNYCGIASSAEVAMRKAMAMSPVGLSERQVKSAERICTLDW